MPESLPEQIVEAIRARLAAIVGDAGATFWYTPTVRRVRAIESTCLDNTFADPVSGKTTLYLLTPDDEEDLEEPAHTVEAVMFVDLVVAREIDKVDHPLKTPVEGLPETIQNRLIRDAKKKLRQDVTLGGLVDNVEFRRTERSAEETFIAGWAVAAMRLQISYSYFQDAP
jgi:hypothetical protein